VAAAPDQMWGTDATATFTEAEGNVTVFAAIDHCTAECVGIHAVKKATRFEALEPIARRSRNTSGLSLPGPPMVWTYGTTTAACT
jgi:putative transposase